MRQYILSIVIAAGICAITASVLNKKTAIGKLVKLIGGIFLTITVFAPLVNITFNSVSDYLGTLSSDASEHVSYGKTMALESISEIIKSQSEAYILDKAEKLGVDLTVEVELDDSNHSAPGSVKLTGTLSPYARGILSAYIEDGLGIAKEKQQWI